MKAFPQMLTIRTCLWLLFVSAVIAEQTLETGWSKCTPDAVIKARVSYRYVYRVWCSDGRQVDHTRNTTRDCSISVLHTKLSTCSSRLIFNINKSISVSVGPPGSGVTVLQPGSSFPEPVEVWLEWYNLTTCSAKGTNIWQRFGYSVQNKISQRNQSVQFRTQRSTRFCRRPITTGTGTKNESYDSSSTRTIGVIVGFLVLILVSALVLCRRGRDRRKARSRAAQNNRQNTNDRGDLQSGVNDNFSTEGRIGRDSSSEALGGNAGRDARIILSPSRHAVSHAVSQNGRNPRDDANATDHSLPPSYEDANRISVSVSSTNPLTVTTSPEVIPPPAYDQLFDTGPSVGDVADVSPPPYHDQGQQSDRWAKVSASLGYL